MKEMIKNLAIWAIATDPIYIGTGGYNIGRVDNTIVRDPVTRIPKIPGSSLAGTWRYYVALYLQSMFRDEYRRDRSKRKDIDLNNLFNFGQDSEISKSQHEGSWRYFEGNRYAAIKCAGQDEYPQIRYDESVNSNTGHCGHCIVCKGFGFSKTDLSWQGILFFSDLNILFFPVYTRLGVKWITTERIIKEAGLFRETVEDKSEQGCSIIAFSEKVTNETEGWLNLGWLNLPYKRINGGYINFDIVARSLPDVKEEDICIVPENLITQIINSNLEVRTSVSINPITGAAKEGALFTSEAIPRATTFYGNIRIFDKSMFSDYDKKIGELPSTSQLKIALKDTSHFYETLGIGGMTTRGFGRLIINIDE